MKLIPQYATLLMCLASSGLVSATDPVSVVSQAAVSHARQPQAAVDPHGIIYVTFGAEKSIYCCRSTDSGATFGEPVKIDDVAGLALGRRRGPRIVAGSNAVVVTAISHDTGNLSAWRSTDGGAMWSQPTLVNDSPNDSREGLHAMAMSPRGDIYCTWLDLRSGKTEVFGSLSTDDGQTWNENRLVYHSPSGSVCECCHPAVTYDAGGNLHVMWRNSLDGFRDMYTTVSRDGGKTFAESSRQGSDQWKLNACPMDGGWLAANASNQLTTVWRRDKRLFRTDSPRPGEQLLGIGLQPWVAGTSKGAYIVWIDRRGGVLWSVSPGQQRPQILAEGANDPVVVAPISETGPVVAVWETGSGPNTGIKALVLER